MTPTPRALELLLCRQVIVDSLTGEPSCIGVKTSLRMDFFPSLPQELAFFCSLTDGKGEGNLELSITSMESGAPIYISHSKIHLQHRLSIANVYGNLVGITFPNPDVYAVSLLVDDQLAAIRHIPILEKKQ